MKKMPGLYRHIDERGYLVYFFRKDLEYEGEGNITICQYKEYIMVQKKPDKGKKGNRLEIFKNGELCMEGSTYRVLNKEEMEKELKWCVEQYEEEQHEEE